MTCLNHKYDELTLVNYPVVPLLAFGVARKERQQGYKQEFTTRFLFVLDDF